MAGELCIARALAQLSVLVGVVHQEAVVDGSHALGCMAVEDDGLAGLGLGSSESGLGLFITFTI